MRKPIVAANWKMNKTSADTEAFLHNFLRDLGSESSVEIVVVPPFTALAKAADLLKDTSLVRLGAQNMHPENSGAFTGEISAGMLRDLYVKFVVLGHSERRSLFGESDAFINKKLHAAHAASLKPIFCIGETLEERDGGRIEEVLGRQLREGLAGLSEKQMLDTVIAYEPVWAIGTGRTATPEQAQETHAYVRKVVAELHGQPTADRVRIQYGGSVKPNNAAELMGQPDIDGALVGGASLDPADFLAIVRGAAQSIA